MTGEVEAAAAASPEPVGAGGARGIAGALARALAPVVLALVAGGLVLVALGVDPLAFYANVVRRGLFSYLGLQATITAVANHPSS